MLDALHDAAADRLDSAERGWSDRIEARRAELSASTELIETADFGAESPEIVRRRVAAGTHRTQSVGAVCRTTSKSPRSAAFLMKLSARAGALRSLELGTSLGISGAYQAAGLEGNGGTLVTLEGDPARAAIARETFDGLGLERTEIVTGRFSRTLPGVLDGGDRFDTVFIDGHHDGRATIDYHDLILPSLASGAVVVYDDIDWSNDMNDAWRTLRRRPEFVATIDCGRLGVCVHGARGAGAEAEHVTIPATWL